MKQLVPALSLLVAGFVLGWYGREWTAPEATERATPRQSASERATTETVPPPREADAAPPRTRPETDGADASGGEEDREEAAVRFRAALAEHMKTQLPVMRAWASMQAKSRIGPMLTRLGFDEETARRLEEAIGAEAARQSERAFAMLVGEGEELDPNAFYWLMGVAPELAPEFERELAGFLGPDDLDAVKTGMRETHETFIDAQVDMQIGMMAIGDVTPTQKTRVRDVFAGQDMLKEQMVRFAEVFRDPERLQGVLGGKGLDAEMEANLGPQRQRMRDILTPQQFEKYRAYEKVLKDQVQSNVRMMAGMMKLDQVKPARKE